MKRVVVVGLGYVGLPLSLILAKVGYHVTGVDIREDVVEQTNNHQSPLREEEISRMFALDVVKKNFSAKLSPCEADAFIICVPTPLETRRKVADLSYLISAVESITPVLRPGNLVVIESTVPPLTLRETVKPLIESKTDLRAGTDLYLAHCPERVLPGNTFQELVHNNRVIGGIDRRSALEAKKIYGSFVEGDVDIVDDVTAETVKLMENTYRDVNIALANELSLIADTLEIDAKLVIDLANKHPRVKILSPGIGVGGHCIPKDPWFLIQVDPRNSELIATGRRINETMPDVIASKVRRALKNVENPRVVALGMTYKPDSDDLRGSPALDVVEILKEDGYDITPYDDFVEGRGFASIYEIARGADALVVLVEHTKIRTELESSEAKIKSAMKTPLILRIGTSYSPDDYDRSQMAGSSSSEPKEKRSEELILQ